MKCRILSFKIIRQLHWIIIGAYLARALYIVMGQWANINHNAFFKKQFATHCRQTISIRKLRFLKSENVIEKQCDAELGWMPAILSFIESEQYRLFKDKQESLYRFLANAARIYSELGLGEISQNFTMYAE